MPGKVRLAPLYDIVSTAPLCAHDASRHDYRQEETIPTKLIDKWLLEMLQRARFRPTAEQVREFGGVCETCRLLLNAGTAGWRVSGAGDLQGNSQHDESS